MAKVFEDVFTELLADMVSEAVDYAEERVEKAFVFSESHNGCITGDFFFQFHGQIVSKTRLNLLLEDGEKPFDISGDAQGKVLHLLIENRLEIDEACRKFQRTIPVDIFVSYDLRSHEFSTDCRYEDFYKKFYRKHRDSFQEQMIGEWMLELAKPLGTELVVSPQYVL